jgi:ligand-binding SRPBCC domain-containing protein
VSITFERTSLVAAAPDEVWQRVTSAAGINYELMPIMRMSIPRSLKNKSIQDVPIGKKIGRSWFFLLGFLPIDFDDITIAEYEPGRRFLEQSTMMSMSKWEHERTLTGRGGASEICDRVTFRLRPPTGWIPGAHKVIGAFLSWLFGHRHRRLVRWFRESSVQPAGKELRG